MIAIFHRFLNQATKLYRTTTVVPVNHVFFTTSAIIAGESWLPTAGETTPPQAQDSLRLQGGARQLWEPVSPASSQYLISSMVLSSVRMLPSALYFLRQLCPVLMTLINSRVLITRKCFPTLELKLVSLWIQDACPYCTFSVFCSQRLWPDTPSSLSSSLCPHLLNERMGLLT